MVPHAGTPAGNKALEYAKEMAKKHQSEITILHVVENIPVPSSIAFSYEKREWAKELRNARRELKDEMHEKLSKLAVPIEKENIPVTVKVLIGFPDEEIIRLGNDKKHDVVIMAKRRKLPGIKAILKLGSISRKVLEKVHCPVMLIDGEKK